MMRAGVPMISVDITAAFASAPHDLLLQATQTAGWPAEVTHILATTLRSGLSLGGTTYHRAVGGPEGSPLMPAAFAALFIPICGEESDVYADDCILSPDIFEAFQTKCQAAGLHINMAKSYAANCGPADAPASLRRDPPDAVMLGVPVHEGTASKAEKRLADLVAKLPSLDRHTRLTLTMQAAEACRFAIITGLKQGALRIDKLLREAELSIGCNLPTRWQPAGIAQLRASSMIEIAAKGWHRLHMYETDPWVAEALGHAQASGLSFSLSGERTIIHRAGVAFELGNLAQLLPTPTRASGPTDCLERALYTLGPRQCLDDNAFSWAVATQSPAELTADLVRANGGTSVCRLCQNAITADHPTLCIDIAAVVVTRTFTHNAILDGIAELARRLALPCTANCSAPGFRQHGDETFRPDLAVAGMHAEIKTVVPDAHANPLGALRNTIRASRAHYKEKGMAKALVIGVTTRGILSTDSNEDLAALNKQFVDAAWRPTPDLVTVIGTAVARAGAHRRAIWITKTTTSTRSAGAA